MRWLLLFLLFPCVATAQDIETSAWDISAIFGHDEGTATLVMAAADPVSNATAMRVYAMMEGFIAVLQSEHIMMADGTCYAGYRSADESGLKMLYISTPCYQFNRYHEIWLKSVRTTIKSTKSSPLEEQG